MSDFEVLEHPNSQIEMMGNEFIEFLSSFEHVRLNQRSYLRGLIDILKNTSNGSMKVRQKLHQSNSLSKRLRSSGKLPLSRVKVLNLRAKTEKSSSRIRRCSSSSL